MVKLKKFRSEVALIFVVLAGLSGSRIFLWRRLIYELASTVVGFTVHRFKF